MGGGKREVWELIPPLFVLSHFPPPPPRYVVKEVAVVDPADVAHLEAPFQGVSGITPLLKFNLVEDPAANGAIALVPATPSSA